MNYYYHIEDNSSSIQLLRTNNSESIFWIQTKKFPYKDVGFSAMNSVTKKT